jgi:NADH-quinone oxidoreductase subunit G
VYLNEIDASKLSLSGGDKVVLVANETEVQAIVDISNRCNPGAVIVPKVSDDQGLLKLAQRESVSWVEVKKC